MQSATNWEEIDAKDVGSPLPTNTDVNGRKENIVLPTIKEVSLHVLSSIIRIIWFIMPLIKKFNK